MEQKDINKTNSLKGGIKKYIYIKKIKSNSFETRAETFLKTKRRKFQ